MGVEGIGAGSGGQNGTAVQANDDKNAGKSAVPGTDSAAGTTGVGGTGAGTAARMSSLGKAIPEIRGAYEREVKGLIVEIDRRVAAGQSSGAIAEWAVNERHAIANRVRAKTGLSSVVAFELRDWQKYGVGGRNFDNMQAYNANKYGVKPNSAAMFERLIDGAKRPNAGVSAGMVQSAKALRFAGRIALPVSISASAYNIMTAPDDKLGAVISEEAGGMAGGFIGTGLAVAGYLALASNPVGWAVLTVGAIGGIAGGYFGSDLGDRLYGAIAGD